MKWMLRAVVFAGLASILASIPASQGATRTLLQAGQSAPTEFTRLAALLAEQRLAGGDDNEKLQEQALSILDGVILETLNRAGEADLNALNQRLARMVAQQPPLGEDYRFVRLSSSPTSYALAANFGLGGPSAVRLYQVVAGRYALVARIDRFTQRNFFDEYLELVPLAGPSPLFVTVTGRTDDLQTGSFAAWRLEGQRVTSVWASDILPQSSYESRPDGFQLTYCAETDDDNPRVCHRMTRERYAWEGASWKRVQQTAIPVPKR